MKNIGRLFILAVSILLSHAAVAAQHVLLVGISDYEFERVPDLEGPINDVDALRSVLVKQWQFEPDNITALVDEQATEKAVLKALDALYANSKPGDDLIFYFSGHGTSASDPEFGSRLNLPDGTGVIVTHDFDPKKLHSDSFSKPTDDGLLVGRHELKPRLQQLEKERNVLVMFDACFSGNATRASRSRYQPKNVRQLNIVTHLRELFKQNKNSSTAISVDNQTTKAGSVDAINSDLFPYTNAVFFGASAEDELAVDFSQSEIDAGIVSTVDGKAHGGFTDSLLRALDAEQTPTQSLSFIQLFNRIVNQFNHHCKVCGHTPVSLPALADASHALLNKTLFHTTALASNSISNDNVKNSEPSVELVVDAPQNLTERLLAANLPARSVMLGESPVKASPDVIFERHAETIQVLSADGNLITHFQQDEIQSQLSAWLQSRQWLKQRMQQDLRNEDGLLSVEFRHPMYGMHVSEGDTIHFTINSERDSALLALVLDSRGALSVLYPVNEQDAQTSLLANVTRRVPDVDQLQIQVTPPWGTDTVLFYELPLKHEMTESIVAAVLSLAQESSIEIDDARLQSVESRLNARQIPYSASSIRIVARAQP